MTHEHDKRDNLDNDCLEAFDHLYAYLNGELKDQSKVAMIEHHLQHCRSCFSRAEFEREINQRLKKTDTQSPPSSLSERMKKLIDNF
ncbi:MAG: zf-HC2 domain-containing protein [Betaproteobacteria bacterium]|nr:zf-HC2 domain-containing protein [Betaproteobacteria bacterium]